MKNVARLFRQTMLIVILKSLYILKHTRNKVTLKSLYILKHTRNKVTLKTLYIVRHSRNLLKWKLQAFLFNSLNHLELDSTPPNLDSNLYSSFSKPSQNIISPSHASNKIKVGYAILIWERYEYLSDVLESLFNSNLEDTDITFFLIDDGSKDYRIRDYLPKIQQKYSHLDIRVHFENHLNGTAGSVINRAVRIMTSTDSFEILGWGDPDCIYNKVWLIQSLGMFKFIRHSSKHKIRVFTSYNSATTLNQHRVIDKIGTPYGEVVIRNQFGMANVLVRLDDLQTIGLFHETPDDESIFIKRLLALGYVGACPLEGLIEHVGENSALNSNRPVSLPRADFSMKLREDGWPTEVYNYSNYSIEKYIKRSISTPMASLEMLDVAIVSHPKDFLTLPLVVRSLHLFLKHPIGDMFLISEISPDSNQLASELNMKLIDENIFFPFSYEYDLRSTGYIDRTGWLRQQFMKLNVDSIGASKNILVIDGDTVLLRDQAYIFEGKNLLQFSDEYHQPYFQSYLRIFGYRATTPISCITHKMVFNKARLSELKLEIERRHGIPWHKAIYLSAELSSKSGISEYELYGHWMIRNYPEEIFTNFWSNLALDQAKLESMSIMNQKYGGLFETVSFHKYLI